MSSIFTVTGSVGALRDDAWKDGAQVTIFDHHVIFSQGSQVFRLMLLVIAECTNS
jgi:hypothetical protein